MCTACPLVWLGKTFEDSSVVAPDVWPPPEEVVEVEPPPEVLE